MIVNNTINNDNDNKQLCVYIYIYIHNYNTIPIIIIMMMIMIIIIIIIISSSSIIYIYIYIYIYVYIYSLLLCYLSWAVGRCAGRASRAAPPRARIGQRSRARQAAVAQGAPRRVSDQGNPLQG